MSLAISVVVPTFNRKDNLKRTLDGLARQEMDPSRFEVVVVSDGSTDGTDEWLSEVVDGYPFRLRPVRQANSGPAVARNRGIEEAEGDVIVFVDDDIEPQPELLARHLAHHESHPAVAVIGPQLPDPDRRRQEPPWVVWEHEQMVRQYRNFADGTWPEAGPHHFYTGNASVRREHLAAIGGFNVTFGRQEDVELAMRLVRDRGVEVRIDLEARAIHRPNRTYASWARTPYAYGELDVKRAHAGNASWRLIWESYNIRNRATRLAVDMVLAVPRLGRMVCACGGSVSHWLWKLRLGPDSLPLSLLSLVYNVRYAEGVRDAIGGRDAYLRCIRQPTPATGPG